MKKKLKELEARFKKELKNADKFKQKDLNDFLELIKQVKDTSIDKVLSLLNKELEDIGYPKNGSSLGELEHCEATREKVNKKIEFINSLKNKKGKRMGNSNRETELIEDVEFVEQSASGMSVEDFKKELFTISEVSSQTLSEITKEIQFNEVDKVDAVQKLKDFVLKQEELAKPYGLSQRAAKLLTNIPLIGNKMKETYKELKEDHLESRNVKDIIYKVYDDMIENGEKITKRVMKFNSLRKELKESLEKSIDLRDKVVLEIESVEDDSMEKFELQKLQLTLNGQIGEFNEEIRNLQQIETVTKGIAMQITENTPSNKDRLLRKIASFATISEANDQLNAFKELRDLTTSLDNSIQEAIFNTVENVLDGDQQTKREIQKAQKRAEDFSKRAIAIDNKINQGKKDVLLALANDNKRVDQMVLEYKDNNNE